MLVIAAQQIPDDIETPLAAFKNVPSLLRASSCWEFFSEGIGCGADVTALKMESRFSLAGR